MVWSWRLLRKRPPYFLNSPWKLPRSSLGNFISLEKFEEKTKKVNFHQFYLNYFPNQVRWCVSSWNNNLLFRYLVFFCNNFLQISSVTNLETQITSNTLFNFQLMKEKIQLANSIIIIIIIHHNRSYNPHGAQACLFNINQIFHNLIHVCRVGNTFTPLLFSFRSTHLVVNLCYTNHHLFYSSSCRYTGVLQELVRSRYEYDYGKIRDVLGSWW